MGCALNPIRSTCRTTASICSGRAPASITISIRSPWYAYAGGGIWKPAQTLRRSESSASIIHQYQRFRGIAHEEVTAAGRSRQRVRGKRLRSLVLGRYEGRGSIRVQAEVDHSRRKGLVHDRRRPDLCSRPRPDRCRQVGGGHQVQRRAGVRHRGSGRSRDHQRFATGPRFPDQAPQADGNCPGRSPTNDNRP